MSTSDEPPTREGRLKRLISRKKPLTEPDASGHEADVERWRAYDPKWNESSSVPEGERVDLHCVWGVEFYTPSHFDGLVSSFERLAHDMLQRGLSSRSDPAEWLHSLRPSRFSGGWLYLDPFAPTEQMIYAVGAQYKVPMPEYFRYAVAKLHSVSASLTALVVGFVLTDEHSKSIHELLQEDRESSLIPKGQGYTVYDPANQKRDDLKRLRDERSAAITDWFGNQFPGVFSSGTLQGTMPTCELITTRQAVPFPAQVERERLMGHFMGLLGIDIGWYAWKSADTAGLRFGTIFGSRYHAVMAVRDDELTAAMGEDSESSRSARVQYVELEAGEVVLAWAITVLIDECTTQIVKARNTQLQKIKSRDRAVAALDDIENEMLGAADVAAVAVELAEHAGARRLFGDSVPTFIPVEPRQGEESVSMADRRHEDIHDKASWLQQFELATRERATQIGTLIGASENVRLQKSIKRFTIAVAAMTVVGVTVVLIPVVRWILALGT